jgi:hypothetical protein
MLNIFTNANQTKAQETAVGDYSSYKLTLTSDGIIEEGSAVQKITSYNAATELFEMRTVTEIAEEVNVFEDWFKQGESLSATIAASVLATCEADGSILETITVPAGTFQTCRKDFESGQIWIGIAPFGYIKLQEEEESQILLMELSEYQFGK